MPVWRGLLARWPHAVLGASEGDVGLPAGQMGNSEVGHLNLGAGRPVLQDLPRIDAAIADGSFFERPALVDACDRALAGTGRCTRRPDRARRRPRQRPPPRRPRGAGGPPGRPGRRHPRPARRPRHAAIVRRRVHLGPGGPAGCGAHPDARIATVGGRYFAMDRDQALGPRRARLRRHRPRGGGARGERDGRHRGRLRPRRERRVRRPDGHRWHRRPLRDGEPIIHVNFRADRARQLTHALADDPAFDGFDRSGPAGRPAARGPAGRDDDRVRGRAAGRGRLPARGGPLARRRRRRRRLAPVPRRGDREVRARDVLLQRRGWKRSTRARTAGWSRARRSRPTTWRPR